MNTWVTTAGLALVIVTAGLLLFFTLTRSKRRVQTFRNIPAFQHLRRSVGLSVEQGSRLHVTLGSSTMIQPSAASALAGLAALERLAEISSISDRPPVATSGDGSLALLSKDSIRAAYRQNVVLDLYEPDRGYLTGPTPFSYAAGAIPIIKDEHISTNVMIGHFGPEVALLTQAANQNGQFSIAGSDALPAQAVLYASAQEALIGEEVFAIPAYLQGGRVFDGSLQTQDVLRWLLIGGMVLGSILVFLNIL